MRGPLNFLLTKGLQFANDEPLNENDSVIFICWDEIKHVKFSELLVSASLLDEEEDGFQLGDLLFLFRGHFLSWFVSGVIASDTHKLHFSGVCTREKYTFFV